MSWSDCRGLMVVYQRLHKAQKIRRTGIVGKILYFILELTSQTMPVTSGRNTIINLTENAFKLRISVNRVCAYYYIA